MLRSRVVTLAIVGALLTTAGSACRSGTPFEEEGRPNSVGLVVRNEQIFSMDIYVVNDGLATRVGDVDGLATKRFTLDGSFFSASDVRIVATPIGGNGRASTGTIMASPGNTIEFRIATSLRASTVSVH